MQSKSSLFFSLKHYITKLLINMPRKENLNPFEAAIYAILKESLPLLIAIPLLIYIQYTIIILSLAWIPYSIWFALCKIYKWKDSHKESED